MPDAYHDQSHQHYCSIRAKDIQQDLRHRLSHTRADRACEVLDREKQSENEEEAKYGGYADRHDNPHGSAPSCVARFFREMSTCVESGQPNKFVSPAKIKPFLGFNERILREEYPTSGYIGRRSTHTPAWITGTIIECCEHELCTLMGRSFGQDGNGECKDT